MNTKEQAFANLLDFKSILDRLGVVFFLDGGTLLGFYRDKDFCEDDENDIDLGSYAVHQSLIPTIIEEAEKEGFRLHKHWKGDSRAPNQAQEIAVLRHSLKIDLFFHEKKDDVAWAGVYDTDDHLIPKVIPYKIIEKLDKLHFRGVDFNIPNNIEDYLKLLYGDWKTPIHRRDYSCYNPEQLRALKPNFKFWE